MAIDDLLGTTALRRLAVLIRPLAGVAGFATAWISGAPWLCPVGVFASFLCVIATTHDLVHGSLGLGRRGRDLALLALPVLVLQSGHVYRTTHPQHHRVFPGPDDPEGLVADRTLARTLLEGPVFLPRLWLWAYARTATHPRQRRLLLLEAILPAAGIAVGALLLPYTASVLTWVVLNALAGWLLPLLTVWLPHRNHGDTPETVAGSLRWPVVPRLLLGLTYHLEHHLYPQVPSHHMAELAARLREGPAPVRQERPDGHGRNRDGVREQPVRAGVVPEPHERGGRDGSAALHEHVEQPRPRRVARVERPAAVEDVAVQRAGREREQRGKDVRRSGGHEQRVRGEADDGVRDTDDGEPQRLDEHRRLTPRSRSPRRVPRSRRASRRRLQRRSSR